MQRLSALQSASPPNTSPKWHLPPHHIPINPRQCHPHPLCPSPRRWRPSPQPCSACHPTSPTPTPPSPHPTHSAPCGNDFACVILHFSCAHGLLICLWTSHMPMDKTQSSCAQGRAMLHSSFLIEWIFSCSDQTYDTVHIPSTPCIHTGSSTLH